MLRFFIAAAILSAPGPVGAQEDARAERVMARVRSAVVTALPFQASDAFGALPADGKSSDPWMIKPHQPGDQAIEILANPLNEEYQRRAAKAMAQIEQSIGAAQRRAELQYERAIAEAKRTRRSQDVDGVTLSDEGVAGARIDAESHLIIDVLVNQPAYRFEIGSSVDPSRSSVPGSVISFGSNVYRDSKTGEERFCEGQTLVYLGRTTIPSVTENARVYTVTADGSLPSNANAISSIVIRLRGNESLIADLLRKGNWSSVLELIE